MVILSQPMKFPCAWPVCCSAGSFLSVLTRQQTNMDDYFEVSQHPVDIVQEKISADDVKLLLEFYREHPILWSGSHSQYRNYVEKNKVKDELVKSLGHRFPIELLEIDQIHSLRISMRREVKLQLEKTNGEQEPAAKKPKRHWVHYESMIFMKEEI